MAYAFCKPHQSDRCTGERGRLPFSAREKVARGGKTTLHMENCHEKNRISIIQQGKAILYSWLCSFPGNGKGPETETRALMQGVDVTRLEDQEISGGCKVCISLSLTDACHFCFLYSFLLSFSCWRGRCFPVYYWKCRFELVTLCLVDRTASRQNYILGLFFFLFYFIFFFSSSSKYQPNWIVRAKSGFRLQRTKRLSVLSAKVVIISWYRDHGSSHHVVCTRRPTVMHCEWMMTTDGRTRELACFFFFRTAIF